MVHRRHLLKMIAGVPIAHAIGFDAPALGAAASPPRAIVVGVNRYQSLEPLVRACADAEAIGRRLEEIGYAVTAVYDPDQAQLRAALTEHVESIDPETPSFFFFAGHAVQVQGTNLLLPTDAATSSAEAMADTGSVMHLELQRIASRRPSQSIVMIDACRNDPFRTRIPAVETGIASVHAPGGFYIVYSAGSGETALDRLGEDDTNRNGVFTRALLPQLLPNVSVHEIVQRTKAEVSQLASSIGHSQHPAVYDQSAGDLSLLGERATETNFLPPIATPSDPQTRFLAIGMQRTRYWGTVFNLNGAEGDARLIGSTLRANGIAGTVLIDPDEQEMQLAISALARSAATTLILYFAGNGMFRDGDGVLLSSNSFVDLDRGIERSPQIGDILREFREEARDRRAILLIDCCLPAEDSDSGSTPSGYLSRLIADPSEVQLYCPAALMCAADIGSVAYDLTPDRNHGPFATALHNALSRPGRTMSEIAEQVRIEVAQITSHEVQSETPAGVTKEPRSKGFTISRTQRIRESRASVLPEVQRTAFWSAPGLDTFVLTRPLAEM